MGTLTRPGSLRLHFQPIVDLARGVIAGYEALARFAGPPHASPDRWFAAARAARLGHELEARAVTTALGARKRLPPNTFLSINVDPSGLRSEAVATAFAAHDDLRGVVVELTESEPIGDYGSVGRALEPLRERGAVLAVDDAGAGFASLRHILRLRPDLIKIDGALTREVDVDRGQRALTSALIAFARETSTTIVAEGLETDAQVAVLRRLGVQLGQGYRLGRPAAAAQAAAA